MSTTIDQRVVEMKFDNKDFEKNISTSMSSLQKFQNSLNFSGATKGIEEINRAAGNFSLGGMENSASSVALKFDAMQVAAITAISKIVDSAMDAGVKLVKSLSIDQITAGWDKYGKKTTSVATLVSQGYDMLTVEEQMKRLNWYTDETSYNFTDMVANIAKFTATGQDLEDSVTAMMGIANWAALSGQNATKASQAMYQLSQAMGKGALKYDDWKSIQNASMDTMEFRQQAVKAAEALGILRSNANGTYNLLTELGEEMTGEMSLQELFTSDQLTKNAWFTSDVMMEVFGYYASAVDQIYDYTQDKEMLASEAIKELGDEVDSFGLKAFKAAQEARTWADVIDSVKDAVSTGWMNTFELIIGNYEEATSLFTDLANALYDVFAESGNVRNELLEEGMTSGWKKFLGDNAEDADIYIAKLKEVARENGVAIDDMIEEYGSFEKALKTGWLTKDILEQLFLPGGRALEEFSAAELEAIGYTQDEADAVKALGAAFIKSEKPIEDWITEISRLSGRENVLEAFWNAWEGAGRVIGAVKDALESLFPQLDGEMIYQFTVKIKEFTETFQLSEEAANGLKNILTALVSPLKIVFDVIGKGAHLFGTFAEYAFSIVDSFLAVFESADSVSAALKDILGEERYERSAVAIKTITDNLSAAFEHIEDQIRKIKEQFKGSEKLQSALKSIHDILKPIGDWILDRIVEGLEAIARIDFVQLIDNAEAGLASLGVRFEDVETFIVNAINSVKGFFAQFNNKNVRKALVAFLDETKKLRDIIFSGEGGSFNLDTALNAIWSTIEKALPILTVVKNELAAFVQRLTPAKILIFSFGLSTVSMFLAITKAITGAANMFESVKGFFDILTGRFKVSPIIKMAYAVELLALALTVLSLVDPTGLKQATISLSIMSGVLTIMLGIVALIEKFLMKDALDSAKFAALSTGILMLATSLLAMAGALWIVSKVDTSHIIGQLLSFAAVLGGMIAAVWALKAVAPALSTSGLFLISFAGAIVLLTYALKTVSSIKINEVKDGLNVLMTLFSMMTLMSIASKFGGTVKFSGFTSLAIGLIAMVGALKILQKIDAAEMLKTLPQIIIIVGMMIALGKAASLGGQYAARAGLGIVLISSAIIILTEAIKRLGNLDLEQIKQGGIAVVILMGVITGLLVASKNASKELAGAGTGILLISASIVILSFAIKKIGELDLDQAKQGTVAVSIIIGMFALVVKASQKVEKAAGSMIAMAVAIGILSAAIILMSLIPFKEAMGASTSLSLALLAFAGATKLLQEIDAKKVLISLVPMGLMIAGIVTVFSLMKDLDGLNTLELAGGLAVTALALSGAVKILSTIKVENGFLKDFGPSLAAMGTILVGLSIIAGLIGAFDKHFKGMIGNGVQVLKNFWMLGGILIEVAGVVAAMGLISTLMQKYGGDEAFESMRSVLAVFASTMVLIIGVALLVGKFSDTFTNGAEALSKAGQLLAFIGEIIAITGLMSWGSTVLKVTGDTWKLFGLFSAVMAAIIAFTSLVGVFATKFNNGAWVLRKLGDAWKLLGEVLLITIALSAVGTLIPPGGGAVKALALFAGVILAITGICLLLGWIASNPTINNLITNGKRVFGELGEIIGLFIGSVVGGVAAGFEKSKSDALPGIADNIASFANKLQNVGLSDDTFAEHLKTIGQGFKDLADATVELSYADPEVLVTFSEAMQTIAPNLVAFDDAIAGHDFANMETAVSGLRSMADIVNILPKKGGVAQKILGEPQELKQFGEGIVILGKSMARFFRSTRYIKEDIVNISIGIAESLAALNGAIPETGGALQWLIGENDMSKFADNLPKLGQGLKGYYDKIKAVGEGGFNKKIVDTSTSMGEALAKLNQKVPSSGGFIDWLFGSNSLGDFADNITSFGAGLWSYWMTVKSINVEDTTAANELIYTLIDVSNSIEKYGGLEKVFGWTNASRFSDDVANIGSALNTFGTKVASLESVNLHDTITEIARLVNLIKGMQEIDTERANAFYQSLNTLSMSGIEGFLAAFEDKESTFATAGETLVIKIIGGIEHKFSSLDASGADVVTKFFAGFERKKTSDAFVKGASLVDVIISGISSKSALLMTAATNLITQFINGMNSKQQELGTKATTIANEAVNRFKSAFNIVNDKSETFKMIGTQVVNGFINGMTNNYALEQVSQAASKLADTAEKATKKKAQIKSPSKVFQRLGAYMAEGLDIGFLDSLVGVRDDVSSGVGGIISGIQDKIDNTIGGVKDSVGGVMDGVIQQITDKVGETVGSFGNMSDVIPSDLENLIPSDFDDSFSNVFDTMNEAASTLPTSYGDIGGEAMVEFTDGMLEKMGYVNGNLNQITSTISSDFSSGLSGLSDTTYSPSITPVYNMDETAVPDLESMEAWTWTADDATLEAISSWSAEDSEHLTTIVDEVTLLRKQMNSGMELLESNQLALAKYLWDELPKMEEKDVLLDGNAIVGKLTPRLNTLLGTMMMRERRQ